MKKYEYIKTNKIFIKYNYDQLKSYYDKSIDAFKSMQFNLPHDTSSINLWNQQLNLFDNEMKKYLYEIIDINNNDIKENGFSNYKYYTNKL